MAEITSLMKDIKGILDNKNQTKSDFSVIKLFSKKIKNSIFHYKNDYLWSFLF